MTRDEKQQFIRKYITLENLVADSIREVSSPDGRFKLVTASYKTGERTWNYTEGKVYRVGEEEPLATVYRNYSSFWHSWVMDHPTGNEYLLCGEDYQNQTWVNLSTGELRSTEGQSFCWYGVEKQFTGGWLLVNGCYWAGPSEFRMYDFSNPDVGPVKVDFYGEEPFKGFGQRWDFEFDGKKLKASRWDHRHKEKGKFYDDLESLGYEYARKAVKAKRAGDVEEEAKWTKIAEAFSDYEEPEDAPEDWEPVWAMDLEYELREDEVEEGHYWFFFVQKRESDRVRKKREEREESNRRWNAKLEALKDSDTFRWAQGMAGLKHSGWSYGTWKPITATFSTEGVGVDYRIKLEAQVVEEEKFTIVRWKRGKGS
jgi:hypothetical protein